MSLKLNKTTYYLKDVAVVQSPISYQLHRADVNPFITTCGRKTLPIFVAPMASVTDENNYKIWIENKVTPVVPRSVMVRLNIKQRLEIAKTTFVSISLQEAKMLYERNMFDDFKDKILYICIDIAHGTLSSLFEICYKIKTKYDNIVIMSGNIANPNAYINYCRHGIDYVRCSIGSGSRCTTSANVSISYGNATLLDEINNIRVNIRHNISDYKQNSSPIFTETKIIADGGIGWFDDIQKSLALGADYVMIGKLFAECNEACEPFYYAVSEEEYTFGNKFTASEMFKKERDCPGCSVNFKKYRDYYGMSTKKSQSITGGDGSKTSEGISKPVEVKHSVSKFLDNTESYLRSCMTYTNSKSLDDLKLAEVVILGGSGDLTYRK